MQCSLKGRTTIVTGSSRGIGREIAVRFGQLGGAVVVNYCKSEDQAEEVLSEITRVGGSGIIVQADMKKLADIKRLFAVALETFGRIDILVNNAGAMVYKEIVDVTEDEFDHIFNLNVKGLFFACQQAVKTMADGGTIINISSTVTKVMMPNYGLYSASKGAVEQITKVLAKELGVRNITVNTVSPGPVDTELFRKDKSTEQIEQLARMSPFGRIGTPADIADTVEFLISAKSGWVTGQNICANGGFTA